MSSTPWPKAEEKNKWDTQKVDTLDTILNFWKIDFFF